MPTPTPDQGITVPDGTDLAAVVTAMQNAIADLQTRLSLRYTNEADRTARHPVSVEGEVSDLAAENRREAYDGAAWISATARGYRGYRIRTADAAAINNSTALVSDAVLSVPIGATGLYVWDCVMFYDATTVADAQFAIQWPGAPANRRSGIMGRQAATATNIDAPTTTTNSTGLAVGGNGAGTTTWARMSGYVQNTGAAGNLVVMYAQNTLEVSNLFIRAGSRMSVLQVS